MKKRRSLGIIVSMAMALTMLGAASGPAAAATRFGAKLDNNTEPSNCCPPHACVPAATQCTWILNIAYHRTTATAPMDGTIHKVRVIAGQAGHMKLFVGRLNGAGQGKVTFKGPRIDFLGHGFDANKIETFNVSMPIKAGDSIAVRAGSTSALRCDSGSAKIRQFVPALVVGGPFVTETDHDGCYLLVEYEY
jgi:hypothetical protein